MTVRPIYIARQRNHAIGWQLPAFVHRLPAFAFDFAVVLSVVGVYFLLRGAAPDRQAFATSVTEHIVSFEQTLHIFWEPRIQELSIRYHPVQEVANFTYAYLHFPVLGAVGVWLWFRQRERFVFIRNVWFVSMLFGLVFYFAFPAAPPRLLAMNGIDLGFTDTVFGGNTAVNYAQPSLILNEYAAIPSFHFGWIALAAAAIWVNTDSRVLRGAGVGLAVLMTWAIVASANHFFFDMALGGVVIMVSWRIAAHIEARGMRRSDQVIAILPTSKEYFRAA
ncbi:hypothetical protein AYO38_05745 [bacterium SCGC AG-212-C10]|nr:hypothetical protein AYO38_05745 [bacterium SCGC AG-212-C10]